jgi:hypothetical protein
MPRRVITLFAIPSLAFAQEKTTYDEHVFPIFQQSCLNCHNPDKTKGGLDLSSFSSTIKGGSGGKIVEPGDVGSVLITCVQHTSDKKMPPEGDKLSSDQIAVLKRWIDGGLLENKSSSARKPPKPKFETALSSNPAAKPDGPPPMPEHLLLEPPVVTTRAASIHAIAASPWAPLLAVTGHRQILLHHTESLKLVGILPFSEGEPVSLAFTPDARYLIVGGGVPGKSGVTVTFDITTGSRLLTAAKEFDSVLAADIRPSFDLVATGGPSRLLKIWNTETGELVKSIKKHTDWITALDLSTDGVLLASGDRNGSVWVWESQTANEFHTLRGHQAAITATVFRSDSNLLATASEDGTLRFWEMNGGSEVKKIDAHPGGVTGFAFARDGMSLSAGRDMKAKLWKQDFSHARDLAQNLPALPTAVALDSEGKRAFVADSHGTVRVFQTADAKCVGEFQANPPTIAARLETLSAESAKQEQATAAAEKAAAEASHARDTARQILADAEKNHLQAVEPHKTALDAAEKTLTQTTAELENARSALADIKAAHKDWTAAAINTRALTASRQAEESALTIGEQQTHFTKASDSISIKSNALNLKRSEREQLAIHLTQSDLQAEILEEIKATLTAIDIRIAREAEELAKAENETLELRDKIEHTAPLAHQKQIEAISLREAYLKARN